MKILSLLTFLILNNAYSNVDVSIELDVGNKNFKINEKNISYEEKRIVKQGIFEISYNVSKKLPKEIPAEYNNQKTVLVNISVVKETSILLKDGEAITIYGKQTVLEKYGNKKDKLKITFVVNETNEEKKQRISKIKRLPVVVEGVFLISYRSIEEIKKEVEKLLSSKGRVTVDIKSNSLFVRDTLEVFNKVNEKILKLDN